MPQCAYTDTMTADPLAEFVTRIEQAIAEGAFARLVLSKPRPTAPPGTAQRVAVRLLRLKEREHLSFVDSHPTRDVTLNLPVDAGVQRVRELLGTAFGDAHLATSTAQLQLLVSRKGKATLRPIEATSPSPAALPPRAHDRDKQRFLDLDAAFSPSSASPRAASARAGDGAQVEADQQVHRGARPRARRDGAEGRRGAGRPRLRLRQGLPDVRDPRLPARHARRRRRRSPASSCAPTWSASCNARRAAPRAGRPAFRAGRRAQRRLRRASTS